MSGEIERIVNRGLREADSVMSVNARKKRKEVVTRASRIIDVLRGSESSDGVGPVDKRASSIDSTPSEMPKMEWNGLFGPEVKTRGSLGEFAVSRFNNLRGSEIFDAAFYAGVLAVKDGLVDPDQFTHDSELHADFDPSQLFIQK